MFDLATQGLRTDISEPDRAPPAWVDQHDARDAVYANRRRIKRARGPRLMRRRGQVLERPFALYDTGGMRRTHLRRHGNILKRLLVHAAAANLGLWMRTLTGRGTPRGLQGLVAGAVALLERIWTLAGVLLAPPRRTGADRRPTLPRRDGLAAVTCAG